MPKFIKQFIRHPRKTGAIAASSKHLARAVVTTANLAAAQAVVELGPGTGVFTEAILQHLLPGAVFFALELNPRFATETRQRMARMAAENLVAVLAGRPCANIVNP